MNPETGIGAEGPFYPCVMSDTSAAAAKWMLARERELFERQRCGNNSPRLHQKRHCAVLGAKGVSQTSSSGCDPEEGTDI